MYVKIGGINREVQLRMMDCNFILQKFNRWYAKSILAIKNKYENYLIEINMAEGERKADLIDQYAALIDRAMVDVHVPVDIVFESLWMILTEPEKKRFKNMRKMKKSILVEEIEGLVYFVGDKILNLSGYKKKIA